MSALPGVDTGAFFREFAYSPHALIGLRDSACWIAADGSGAVSYVAIGRILLASEPLAPGENLTAVTREFLDFSRAIRKTAVFGPVTERFARLHGELALDCVPIGISPYFDLSSWSASGRKTHGVRAGVNQARRAGVSVETVSGSAIPRKEIAAVSQAWLGARRTSSFGWVFASDPLGHLAQKQVFVALDGERRLVAFLTASPMNARNAYYLEDVQRAPDAPKGVNDLLITTALESLRAQGVELATLGTAPLVGVRDPAAIRGGRHDVTEKVFEFVARRGGAIYNFAGVHLFKKRFAPSFWEHEYVLAPGGMPFLAPRVAWAICRAIAPSGIQSAIFNGRWSEENTKR